MNCTQQLLTTQGYVNDKPWACAAFPLAGNREEEPGLGRVWIIKDLNKKRNDDLKPRFIPKQFGIYFVETSYWQGDSWQLAGKLASKWLEENCPPDTVYGLAIQWIITGRVEDNDMVKRIQLGNKLDLGKRGSIAERCRWLLPLENIPDIGATSQLVHSAMDTDNAWRHITRRGFQCGEERPCPDKLDVKIFCRTITRTTTGVIFSSVRNPLPGQLTK